VEVTVNGEEALSVTLSSKLQVPVVVKPVVENVYVVEVAPLIAL
jgi:hypothetical protein